MDAIREYILSVTGAAIIGAMVLRFLHGKGTAANIGRMATALFVALTVIGPITDVRISDVDRFFPDVSADAKDAVADGEATAKKALSESISQRLEAYILDKAAQSGVTLSVRVELSEDVIPVPVRVYLQGNVSPYVKTKLQYMIRDDLGLDKEKQIWT